FLILIVAGFSPCLSRHIGPPGVGKTHLAISLAIAAAQSGRRVYYGTLVSLIESLEQAKAAGQLARRLRVLSHPALLIVDEIGYLPVSRDGAVLFFQLINARCSASTMLAGRRQLSWPVWIGTKTLLPRLADCRLIHRLPFSGGLTAVTLYVQLEDR